MQFPQKPLVLALSIALSPVLHAQTEQLPDVKVSASADASAEGLAPAYAGGQVAKGNRVGVLGNQSNMDTPFTVTGYTSELIENQQAASVGDVLLNDPAVRVARGFGNFQQLYLIRGYPVYSDDMSYNGLYGLLPRQYFAAELVERIEVLRGANTFLNGAAPGGSGLGGAINVLPKRAPNTDLNRLTLGVQNGGEVLAAGDFARRSDDGSKGIRANVVKRDGASAVDGEKRSLDLVSLGMDFRSADLRLSADVGYQNHKLKGTQPNITFGAGVPVLPAPDASRSVAQPWTYSNAEDVFATVRAEYDFNDTATGWVAAGFRQAQETTRTANPTVNDTAGNTSAFRFDTAREDDVRTGEAGVRFKFKTGGVSHNLSTSVSAFSLDIKSAFAFYLDPINSNLYRPVNSPLVGSILFPGGGNLSSPLPTTKTETRSLAVADTLGFMDERLLLTLGLRHQDIRQEAFSSANGAQTSAYNSSRVTPVGGVVFKLNPTTSLFANYIEGLVPGETAPTTAAGGGVVTNGGQVFKPYVTEQVEAGVKWDLGQVGASASVFQSTRPVYGLNGLTYGEVGEQENQGLELSAYGVVLQRLKLLGGASFLSTDLNGKKGIGSPPAQFNVNAEWDLEQVRGMALEGRVIHTAGQYANAANTQVLPSWNRLDVGVRYAMPVGQSRMLTLRARLDNVADKSYWASAGGFPGAGYLTVGQPRTLTMSATVDF